MPEHPEVETIVNNLRPQLVGRRFESLHLTRDTAIRAPLVRYPTANTFIRRLRGRTIMSIQRRGKYIVMPLDPAAAANNGSAGGIATAGERVIVHLGMTGHLRVWEPEEAPSSTPTFGLCWTAASSCAMTIPGSSDGSSSAAWTNLSRRAPSRRASAPNRSTGT